MLAVKIDVYGLDSETVLVVHRMSWCARTPMIPFRRESFSTFVHNHSFVTGRRSTGEVRRRTKRTKSIDVVSSVLRVTDWTE
jgi:hypothetical protein